MDQPKSTEKLPDKAASLETDAGVGAGVGSGGSRDWTAAAAQGIWRHAVATPGEQQFLSLRGGVLDAARADAVKAQVSLYAADPDAALMKAVQNNRVVGFADMHVRRGPYFQFLIDEMPKLKAAGITDVAVEIPQPWQKEVDSWTSGEQKNMEKRLTDGQSLLDVVDAAKKAGLKVTAVDEFYVGPGDNIYSRDKTMADNIENLLKDDDKKVLYFVGAEHLASGTRRASSAETTAQRLRDKNVSVETFYQQLPSFPDGMMKSAQDLKVPVSVDTHDASLLGAVGTAGFGRPPYGKFDNVIFYPVGFKMENCEQELKQFGSSASDAMKAALDKNRVVLLGEMNRQDPDNPESGHRKLFADLMPALKQDGLTDLALNIPARYQNVLDGYSAQGALPDGPLDLPSGFNGQEASSFRPVLDAAVKSGLKLHAVGQDMTYSTQMQQVIDGLSKNLLDISRSNNGGKTLLWSNELFVAKFFQNDKEVSVGKALNDAGVSAVSMADFSQDFDKFSPSVVNQLVSAPVVIDAPEKTVSLKTIVNNQMMQMDRFDQVILYPSE